MQRVWELALLIVDFLFPRSEEEVFADSVREEDLAHAALKASTFEDPFLHAALSYHSPPVKALVWSLKYRGNMRAAQLLGGALADSIGEELADRRFFDAFTEPILVPIPLSSKRQEERGFNQAEKIAEALLGCTGGMVLEPKLLAKMRDTPAQTKLEGREARMKNLKGCFRVTAPERVKERNIILLDDVITTGSTMREARDTLLEAGARRVWCIAPAH